jgi:hypothetical protein
MTAMVSTGLDEYHQQSLYYMNYYSPGDIYIYICNATGYMVAWLTKRDSPRPQISHFFFSFLWLIFVLGVVYIYISWCNAEQFQPRADDKKRLHHSTAIIIRKKKRKEKKNPKVNYKQHRFSLLHGLDFGQVNERNGGGGGGDHTLFLVHFRVW